MNIHIVAVDIAYIDSSAPKPIHLTHFLPASTKQTRQVCLTFIVATPPWFAGVQNE